MECDASESERMEIDKLSNTVAYFLNCYFVILRRCQKSVDTDFTSIYKSSAAFFSLSLCFIYIVNDNVKD